METHSRWITLEGATNVRDLGGHTTDSAMTRWGSLFRADNLHRLTAADQERLLAAGVRVVIDLRHHDEVQNAPNVLAAHPGVDYRHIPLFQNPPSASGASLPDLPTIYRYMVNECQPGFGAALAAIAEADGGGVLFHCTAGKDRTGILAALLLRLAGVAPEAVAAEYALTTEAMARLRPAILEQVRQRGGSVEATERMLSSEAPDMLGLLAYVDERYGDVEGYLKAIGLSEAQIERLRARLV